jgi:uncharacterized protein YifN (PemK superfamily)
MALQFHPRTGQVLFCDFSHGFKEPEMVKCKRPVVVLTGSIKGRDNLVTIVPFSTVPPNPPRDFNLLVDKKRLPKTALFMNNDNWLKGDMIYTVGFHRLDPVLLPGKDPRTGARQYHNDRFSREFMKEIYACVLNGMGLHDLVKSL